MCCLPTWTKIEALFRWIFQIELSNGTNWRRVGASGGVQMKRYGPTWITLTVELCSQPNISHILTPKYTPFRWESRHGLSRKSCQQYSFRPRNAPNYWWSMIMDGDIERWLCNGCKKPSPTTCPTCQCYKTPIPKAWTAANITSMNCVIPNSFWHLLDWVGTAIVFGRPCTWAWFRLSNSTIGL